ncbi:TetR/AcrR family transcriptional regulator [Bradyrhizobium sp. 187]|uniref:TetR/AcrR family transcriptional regulator n=1 Tax=Bradyrhizobium sp. 187 TaxID=2782655 RepID=UPI0020001610|nr:TetR/AcrR family transcriptional regulator [Bradyrhizobium sp. 187]UPJ71884.1 TetR/AcrR family transcriptional regulator [Bradyrhizobium sp. 187]
MDMGRMIPNKSRFGTSKGARSKKAPARTPATRTDSRKRLPFPERKELIVEKAAEFFAEFGFNATTRELADSLKITQPLLYKYFKTKEDLIEHVYKRVFLDVWDAYWDDLLVDRTRPIQDRLVDFYIRYTDVIMNRAWMRIYLFAGLKDVGITSSYIKLVEERIIRRIAIEVCLSKDIRLTARNEHRFLEVAWNLQGSIFYYGVRKYAYGLQPRVEKITLIRDAVNIYIKGWPEAAAAEPRDTSLPSSSGGI